MTRPVRLGVHKRFASSSTVVTLYTTSALQIGPTSQLSSSAQRSVDDFRQSVLDSEGQLDSAEKRSRVPISDSLTLQAICQAMQRVKHYGDTKGEMRVGRQDNDSVGIDN